ncbi:DUF2914 domain-containing protein [Pseudoalteromonas sp.]|uniref:DUF2914 domain-containing protein n=1 Tax=Pseudoalteromonas sp. TaxID=53249 RepID=UPI00356B4488
MGQKIVIKANVKREPQSELPTLSYVWNWRRIVSVSMLAIMTSAAVVYGLTTMVNAEQGEPNQSSSASENVASSADNSAHSIPAILAEQPVVATPQPVTLQDKQATPGAELAVATRVAASDVVVIEPASQEPVAPSVTAARGAAEPLHVDTAAPTSDLVVPSASGNTTANNVQGFAPLAPVASVALGAQIDTDKISRAVLTRKVTKREPVNVFAADIRLSQFTATLSFFSELKNLQGQKVTHVWLFEGEVMDAIELAVTSPRYRTYSKKTILDSQIGHWRVDVIDEQGLLIAQKEFRILAD